MPGPRGLRAAGRRTNLGLLWALVGAFGTGWLAFATELPGPARLVVVAHGVLGLTLVALAPWKLVVVRRAPALRVASLLLLVVVLTCLVAGFVEVFGGYGIRLGLSPIQVHVGSAVVLVLLVAWHVLRHRRQRLRPVDVSRRRLLRTGGFLAGAGAAYAAAEGVGRLVGAASATRAPTGSHRLGAAQVPATTWLLDQVPRLDPATATVRVAGAVLSPAELDARAVPVPARLDCTSGWYADATWSGVALADLLDADRLARAGSVLVTSHTGYRRRFPVTDASRLFLATRAEGRLLSPGTGAPVRLVAPGRRGFWWVKWVASVELSPDGAAWQPPFPLQ